MLSPGGEGGGGERKGKEKLAACAVDGALPTPGQTDSWPGVEV